MGVYAITGGSGGIGLRVISQLENRRYPGRPFYSRRTAESN